LAALRAGDGEKAAALLESALDGHIISLTLFQGGEGRGDIGDVLATAKAYRTAHPRSTGNPELDAAVAAELRIRSGK
jgi:hypothetical protein